MRWLDFVLRFTIKSFREINLKCRKFAIWIKHFFVVFFELCCLVSLDEGVLKKFWKDVENFSNRLFSLFFFHWNHDTGLPLFFLDFFKIAVTSFSVFTHFKHFRNQQSFVGFLHNMRLSNSAPYVGNSGVGFNCFCWFWFDPIVCDHVLNFVHIKWTQQFWNNFLFLFRWCR